MSTPKPAIMERKKGFLTVEVLKMKKNGMSEEGVRESLEQLISKEKNVPDDLKIELYNAVLQEVGDLIGLTTNSSAMDTSGVAAKFPSQPGPSGSSHASQQEPPF